MGDMIKMLAEMSVDEAWGACKYAKLAVENKHDQPAMAQSVSDLANQELGHMTTLMAIADNMLAAMEVSTPEQEEHKQATSIIVHYLKEKQAAKAVEARMYLEQYRTM